MPSKTPDWQNDKFCVSTTECARLSKWGYELKIYENINNNNYVTDSDTPTSTEWIYTPFIDKGFASVLPQYKVAARIQGQFEVTVAGSYTFEMIGDDKARLSIDGV